MNNFKVLKDGYIAIQNYLSSVETSYDRTREYLPACRALEAFYQAKGKSAYNPAINSEFRELIEDQVKTGRRSERNGRLYRRFTYMIDDYYSGQQFKDVYNSGKRFKYKLDPVSEKLVEDFKDSLNLSAVVIPGAGTVARSFFYYLHQNELADRHEITEETIVGFLQFKSSENISSMDTVLYFLRKLLAFLSRNGIYSVNPALASYKAAACRRKVLPAFADKEIALLLSIPERSTDVGKRDYAILLLASFTGMREIDIANLMLKSINREERSITFHQHKTGHLNALPVNEMVMDAICDYIDNARPESPLPFVFLTVVKPYRKLDDKTSVKSIFDRHFRKSGIAKTAGDGKSFHAFRRTIGKWLLESSTDAQMISQVLGQHSRDVLKRYLPVSQESLRGCSLDFTLAPLKKGVYQ
ncbi:MAG: tyrosine-type recombinase/integrase [Eubacteriales bacterium]|nr:tyrosine-type recombinase/integrase [Eubacteriales bacterium]